MRILIVTGSRYGTVFDKELEAEIDDSDLVVHGDAPGVDRLAETFAVLKGVHTLRVAALWDTHGRSAGHRRNAILVEVGVAFRAAGHLVRFAAFPNPAKSPGTRNCVERLTRAKIPGKTYE